MELTSNTFMDEFLELLAKYDLPRDLANRINFSVSFRNKEIMEKYSKMIKSGISSKEARELLSNRYYLSEKAIQKIIYNQ